MYSNVGKKIMILAQVLGWIFLIGGIIFGITYLSDHTSSNDVLCVIGFVGGPLLFISSWFLYGFGQLVDDVSIIRNAPKEAPKDTVSDELPEL